LFLRRTFTGLIFDKLSGTPLKATAENSLEKSPAGQKSKMASTRHQSHKNEIPINANANE
jgi:hypothetical protein